MINNKDQVSLSALLRSKPVPSSWAALFVFGRDYVWNQENGWAAWDTPRPGWDEVGSTRGWVLR